MDLNGLLSNQFVPLLLMILVMYFIIFRPKQKEMKKLQEQINAMKTGDKVITQGGIYGKIHVVREESVLISLEEGTKMEVLKTSIAKFIN